MHARHRNRPWSILFVIGILATLVASCAPIPAPVPPGPTSAVPTATPVPTVEPSPTAMPEPGSNCRRLDGLNEDEPREVATGSHFVLDQVILTGPADQFNLDNNLTWRGQLQDQGIQLIPLESCDLGIAGPDIPEDMVSALSKFPHPEDVPFLLPFRDLPNREERPIETRLYQVALDTTIRPDMTFVKALPLIADTTSKSADGTETTYVYVDPNYLVGPLEAGTPCADPTNTEANPFTVGGSPFTVGGSTGGPSGAEANPDIFWQQWALKEIGVSEPNGVDPLPGTGITVAIFDTSPYTDSDGNSVPINNITPPFLLHLSFPTIPNTLTPRSTKSQDVRNHGLFAAGLVHAVAPGSEIHLIRVLNEYGCGDLFALNNVIANFVGFTRSTPDQPEAESQANLVLNLSLGVQQPDTTELVAHGWPVEIYSLSDVMHTAFARGAVIVAAAGNESIPSRPAARMQLPAAFPDVIGVAASTEDKTASCYTNNGDVGAPGADGLACTDGCPCVPLATDCRPDEWDCPWGVVSLSQASSTGYQFWVGTSFAAPLTSGLAAVLLSQPVTAMSPADAMSSIYAGVEQPSPPQSQLGKGIINVPGSLP